MNTRASYFDFPRLRQPASAGTVIVVESEAQSLGFRRRRAGIRALGCMTGRAKLGKLRDGPAIPLEDWGALAP